MKAIIGLGNPGEKYKTTRHNAGFLFIDYLSNKLGISSESFQLKKCNAFIVKAMIGSEAVILAKPNSFMNHSGIPVRGIADYYNIDSTSDLLIAYDDIDISFGSIRTSGESAGGHNGMKSIIQHLETNEIQRIRIGIEPEHELSGETSKFVLSPFTKNELQELQETVFPEAYSHITDTFIHGES